MGKTFLETLGERDLVAEQNQNLLLKQESAALDHHKRLLETEQLLEESWETSDPFQRTRGGDAGLGSNVNDLLQAGSLGRSAAHPGSRRDGGYPPYYFTQEQHRHTIDVARVLESHCPTATTVLDILTQFVIFRGFKYTVVPTKDPEDSIGEEPTDSEGDSDGEPETRTPGEAVSVPLAKRLAKFKKVRLAAKVQKFLDRWMRAVRWTEWETEIFRRTRRDGEAFLIMEPDDETGMTGLRTVEPEQVREPQDQTAVNQELRVSGRDASWRYGILTHRDDTSKPIAYWVVSKYGDSEQLGKLYDADEVFHLKTEWVDRTAKRGVTDFFVNANDFPGVKRLLRNLRVGASAQAGIAYVRVHPPGMVPQALGTTAPRATIQDGVNVVDVPHGLAYEAGPLSSDNGALIDVLQAALRSIGARWEIPEGLVSGDGTSTNFATALALEGPFVRAMGSRQWWYSRAYKRCQESVIDRAAIAGEFGTRRENILDDIEISVEMPPVVPRKALEATQQNEILNERGVLSTQDWTSREDMDFEDQQEKIEQHPIKPMQIGIMGEGMVDEPEDDTASESASRQDNESERV